MADYISRKEAVDAFFPIDPENDGSDGTTPIYLERDYSNNEIESILWEVPSADVEPVRRWIPCSERTPDMPGDYLVCTKNEYYGTKNVSKRYFNGGCWSGRWTNITHWMPLPEPPEEGGTGNG